MHSKFELKRKGGEGSKPLTAYAPDRAFQRVEFYLDVLEAHFARLEAELRAKAAKREAS